MLARLKVIHSNAANLVEKYGEYLFFGFIFFMAVGNAGAEIFSVLLMLAFLLRKSVKPHFQFLRDRTHLFLLAFFVFCAFSLIHSGPFLHKSLVALFLKWMKFCAIFLVTEDFFRSERSLRRVIMALLFVAGIMGFDVGVQVLSGRDLFYQSPLVPIFHADRVVFMASTATLGHGNNLGAYLIPVLLLTVSLLISKGTGRKVWVYAFLTLLLGISLALTFSRGAWVGFLGGLALMLLLSRRYKAGILWLLICTLIFLSFPEIRERIAYTLRPEGGSLRWPVWEASFQMICKHPFVGNGIGTFMDKSHLLLPGRLTYAHNCYLQMWVETGVFSLVFFLLFLGTLLYRGSRMYLKDHDPVLLGIVCGIFGFLIHSFFDTQFYSLRLAYLLWFLLGLLSASIRMRLTT